jgi:hypothetical protein
VDLSIDWVWKAEPHPGVPADSFFVLWQGKLRVDQAGVYTFATVSDDGVRLKLDGRRWIDRWVTQASTRQEAAVQLERGLHDLELEFFDHTHDAECRLLWSLRGGFGERPIPTDSLWHDPALAAERLPPPPTARPPADDAWISMFNGRDLSGWRTIGGSPRVENGVLILERGAEVDVKIASADFEVRGSLWHDSRGGGLQTVGFSYRRPSGSRSDNHVVVHSDGDAHLWDGQQVAAKSGNDRFPIRKWLPFVMRVQGSTLEFAIDGRSVLRGPVSRPDAGFLAFYGNVRDGEGRLELRDLEWRALKP